MDVLDPQRVAETLARFIAEGQLRESRTLAWRDTTGVQPGSPSAAIVALIDHAMDLGRQLDVVQASQDPLVSRGLITPFLLLDAAMVLACALGGFDIAEQRRRLADYVATSGTFEFSPESLPYTIEKVRAVGLAQKRLLQERPELGASFAGSDVAVGGEVLPEGEN